MSAGRRVLAAVLGASVLVSGCGAGWQRVPLGQGAQLALRQQVQVFHRGKVEQWFAVRLTADTISGVPFFKPPACDSCRVAVPRSEVDSIRLGDPSAGFLKGVGVALIVSILLMILACSQIGCDSYST